jgi:hypothetical protein
MEAVAVSPLGQSPYSQASLNLQSADQRADSLIIESSLGSQTGSIPDANFEDLYKSLSVTAKKMVDKINELLKAKLPNGVQSLKPEDVTPDATAEKIVQGATSYFDVFAKQNPNLEGVDLLNKFLETIRGGIKTGYDDAVGTLEGLGAFEFDGVKSGIERTKELIGEKLAAWEAFKRKELGIDPTEDAAANEVTSGIVSQAGGSILRSQGLSVTA